MSITVKYLASLSEDLNKQTEQIEFISGLTIADVWLSLNPDKPMKSNTICAVDFEYANSTDELADNVELAFFPPVTGG